MTMNPWFATVIWGIVIIIFTGPMLTLPFSWSRRKRNPLRDMPFESGQIPQGEGRQRLEMQYYPYLLMFVVLDVVSMFLFPWGIIFATIPLYASFPVLLFLLLLATPLAYGLHLAMRKENW